MASSAQPPQLRPSNFKTPNSGRSSRFMAPPPAARRKGILRDRNSRIVSSISHTDDEVCHLPQTSSQRTSHPFSSGSFRQKPTSTGGGASPNSLPMDEEEIMALTFDVFSSTAVCHFFKFPQHDLNQPHHYHLRSTDSDSIYFIHQIPKNCAYPPFQQMAMPNVSQKLSNASPFIPPPADPKDETRSLTTPLPFVGVWRRISQCECGGPVLFITFQTVLTVAVFGTSSVSPFAVDELQLWWGLAVTAC